MFGFKKEVLSQDFFKVNLLEQYFFRAFFSPHKKISKIIYSQCNKPLEKLTYLTKKVRGFRKNKNQYSHNRYQIQSFL